MSEEEEEESEENKSKRKINVHILSAGGRGHAHTYIYHFIASDRIKWKLNTDTHTCYVVHWWLYACFVAIDWNNVWWPDNLLKFLCDHFFLNVFIGNGQYNEKKNKKHIANLTKTKIKNNQWVDYNFYSMYFLIHTHKRVQQRYLISCLSLSHSDRFHFLTPLARVRDY